MISLNDTSRIKKPDPTYRVRSEAEAAAILVLGPLAIREFDFVTFQLDNGRWDWDVPAAERPLSAAVIKANGGKKFLLARAKQQGTSMAKPTAPIAPACNGLVNAPSDVREAMLQGLTAATCSPIPGIRAIRAASAAANMPATLDAKAEAKTSHTSMAARRARRKAAYECLPKARVDSPKTGKRTSEAETKTARQSGGKTKAAMVGEMLLRFEGCTAAEVMAACGWPSVSMPQQAKACNLILRKEKIAGQTTRYYGSK